MKMLFCLFVCLLASTDVTVEEDVPEWEKELQQELQVQRHVCYDPPPNTHTCTSHIRDLPLVTPIFMGPTCVSFSVRITRRIFLVSKF